MDLGSTEVQELSEELVSHEGCGSCRDEQVPPDGAMTSQELPSLPPAGPRLPKLSPSEGFCFGLLFGLFCVLFLVFFSQKSTLGTTSCKSVTLLFGAAFYLSRNNVIRKERMKNKLLISINNFLTLSPYTFLPLFPEYMRIHSVWR